MNRARIIAVLRPAAVVVTGGIGAAAGTQRSGFTAAHQPAPISASSTAPTPTPSPTTTPTPRPKATDPLTGGKVSNHEVIAAKVENIAAARPQVGLSRADITFVEEVEGAQTRLIAIYHSRFPKRLGPIRSARSTDVQLLPLFGKPGWSIRAPTPQCSARSTTPRSCRSHGRLVIIGGWRRTTSSWTWPLSRQSTKLAKATPIGWTFSDSCTAWCRGQNSIKVRVGHDTFDFRYSSGRYTVRWNGSRSTPTETTARSPRPTMS